MDDGEALGDLSVERGSRVRSSVRTGVIGRRVSLLIWFDSLPLDRDTIM